MPEHATLEDDGRIIAFHIPLKFRQRGGRKEIILPPDISSVSNPSGLLLVVARAFRWQKMFDTGEVASLAELSAKVGMNKAHISGFLRATLLAPDIIKNIVDGNEPPRLSLTRLRDGQIPLLWDEQRTLFGSAPLQVD